MSNETVLAARQACVDELRRFRDDHLITVSRFILVPKNATDDAAAAIGTGGTELVAFLKSTRNATE